MHHCLSLSSILNKQYLRHSGKEFEGSSFRLPFIKCVVHRLQCLVSIFPFSCSCQSITTEWHKFSGTINVHALVTIRWFVMQLRWYVPGIGIFALNRPSWREFKDENVSVYLIKRKDSNLSCSSKYPPHLWTSIVYNISFRSFCHTPDLPDVSPYGYWLIIKFRGPVLLSQLYATNYLPSCVVRVYSIVMMSLWVFGLQWEFRFEIVSQSPHEIIQQLLKHRKYHSRKQEIREVRETRSSYSLDIPNTSDSSNAVRLQSRKWSSD